MERKKKGKYIGVMGALLVHALFVLFLLLVGFAVPEVPEEGGMPVMLGNVPQASGLSDPSLVKVDVAPQPAAPAPQEAPEQEMITQEAEETVTLTPKKETKPETKKETPKKPEKSEAEKAEEARKLAEARAEQARREAEEAARKTVAGAFGKGAQMGSKGTATTGTGSQGSPTGNASTGATSGTGGYGTFSLDGRSIGPGGLPRPAYDVQDEGRVVVTITVNPAGEVIATSINRQTNTVNPALRKAAEEAARKAKFNAVSGLNNQTGTITYYFNLK